jgi:hypothetical protein
MESNREKTKTNRRTKTMAFFKNASTQFTYLVHHKGILSAGKLGEYLRERGKTP